MPSFQYQSLNAAGETRTGVVAAPSRADAVRLLLSKGETATDIRQVDEEKVDVAVPIEVRGPGL